MSDLPEDFTPEQAQRAAELARGGGIMGRRRGASPTAGEADQRTFLIYVCPVCGRESGGNTGCLGSIDNRHPASGFVPLKVVPKSELARAFDRLSLPVEQLGRALRERDEAVREANDTAEMLNRVAGERDEAREALGNVAARLAGRLVPHDADEAAAFIDRALRAAGSEEENR